MTPRLTKSVCPECGKKFSWKAPPERSSGDHEVSLSCPGCGSIFDKTRFRSAR